VAQVEADRERHSRLTSRGRHRAGRVEIRCHRLLDERGHAGSQRIDDDLAVAVGHRADRHQIHRCAFEQLAVIGEGSAHGELPRGRIDALAVTVTYSHHLDIRQAPQAVAMKAPLEAAPDHCDAHHFLTHPAWLRPSSLPSRMEVR
jgi:hypothetical protein